MKEHFGKETRLREREEITGRACLNAILLKIEKTKGRVLVTKELTQEGSKI